MVSFSGTQIGSDCVVDRSLAYGDSRLVKENLSGRSIANIQ